MWLFDAIAIIISLLEWEILSIIIILSVIALLLLLEISRTILLSGISWILKLWIVSGLVSFSGWNITECLVHFCSHILSFLLTSLAILWNASFLHFLWYQCNIVNEILDILLLCILLHFSMSYFLLSAALISVHTVSFSMNIGALISWFDLWKIECSIHWIALLASNCQNRCHDMLLSWEILLCLIQISNNLSWIQSLTLGFQVRYIRALWGCVGMTLYFHVLWLEELIVIFLCSSFTTFSFSFLVCLPSRNPRCHIWSILTLFSSMLLYH